MLVFFVLALTLTREVAAYAAGERAVGPTIDSLLTGLGLILLITFVLRALLDAGGLFTSQTAERFLVVPLLTFALTPYLLVVAWYCRREVANIRRQVRLQV